MAISVVMPALELAQETGKLVAWRKHEGDSVAKGEPLLDIETDKAVVEVEAPATGVLAGIRASVGDVLAVGTTIAWLVAPGEAVPSDAGPAAPVSRAMAAPPGEAARAPAPKDGAGRTEQRLSPKARRLAREHGVDISRITGSGSGGEIVAEDVVAAAAGAAPAPVRHESVGAVGRLMAERTTQSWTTVPHFFVTLELDAGALVDAHAARSSVSYTDLLVAAVSRVLRRHSRLNGTWTGDGIRLNDEVNIGIATAVDDGVAVMVLRSADSLSVEQVSAARREMTERARQGRARPADLAGATFTISNLGMFEIDAFSAIVNAPQAAILAVGRIADRVVAHEGRAVVRPRMTLTLSCDHRVVDGARAAAFLRDLAEAIERPTRARPAVG